MLLIKFHIIWPSGFRGKADGRCHFSNLKISEKKSVKNRKLLKKLDSSPQKRLAK
jgi:hypothetical protein